MKKILVIIVCAAMLFALAVPVAAAHIVLPAAPKADIIIDGVRDDGYGDMFEINSYKNGDGDGATAKVWAAWNDTGIFYYLEVSDTTPNHEHSDRWQRDCVEFFLDWNGAVPDANTNGENPSWQARIASAPNMDGMQQSCRQLPNDDDVNDTLVNGTHYVVKPLAGNNLNGGYIMEVWLPIALTNGNANPLAEGRTLFVDFQVADNQHDGGRSSQAFLDGMHPGVDTQNNNPSEFRGSLTLGAAPAPAVVVAEPAGIGENNGGPADIPAPAVAAPAPAPAPEPEKPAPPTADPISLIIIGSLISAAGIAFAKKRK